MTSAASSPPIERSRWDGVRMTLEEFERLPEEKPNLEYFGGRVVQKAVGKRRHSRAQGYFVVRLYNYGRSMGGSSGPEAHTYFNFRDGVGVRVPDVAYWAPGKPEGDDERMLPPTLAVEVRSKGQGRRPLVEKCRMMREAGVDVCWLIDPESREAYVFEGERDGEPVVGGTLESAFLPGFELALDDLWAEMS